MLAAWVELYHVTCGIEFRGVDLAALIPTLPLNLLHSGSLAVDMFFVLSGFIMVHVHGRDFTGVGTGVTFAAKTLRFLLLRFIRLWPVHVLVLAAYAALHAGAFPWTVLSCGNPETHPLTCDRFDVSDLPNQILMIAGWAGRRCIAGTSYPGRSAPSGWRTRFFRSS